MFALVDGNSFFASCERIFDPSLKGEPLVVLSNNDGCAIARTQEAKDLGIAMAEPYFKIKQRFGDNVKYRSANFMLYGEVSRRFHELVRGYGSRQEVYSIDESFIDISEQSDITGIARSIYHACSKNIGLPVCVGVGSTKTRAKLANSFAKSIPEFQGVCDLEGIPKDTLMKYFKNAGVGTIWGVGRGIEEKLRKIRIFTIYDLYVSDSQKIQKNFSVVLTKIVLEIQGKACLHLEEISPSKKQIITSRSFGNMITSKEDLKEAIVLFCERAGQKLRSNKLRAGSIRLSLASNKHRVDLDQYRTSDVYYFDFATDDTRMFISASFSLLERLYVSGISYKKAGVTLSMIEEGNFERINMFSGYRDGKTSNLMKTMDMLNLKHGQNSIGFATLGKQKKIWFMKSQNRSPNYMHSIEEVPVCV